MINIRMVGYKFLIPEIHWSEWGGVGYSHFRSSDHAGYLLLIVAIVEELS